MHANKPPMVHIIISFFFFVFVFMYLSPFDEACSHPVCVSVVVIISFHCIISSKIECLLLLFIDLTVCSHACMAEGRRFGWILATAIYFAQVGHCGLG